MSAHVDVDSETIAIWGDAMCAALMGDRKELVDLLRNGNKVTLDLAEFLAWLLDERRKGRPRLPAKFKLLDRMARNPKLYDAAMDFERERANWYAVPPFPPYKKTNKRRFPYEKMIREVVQRWGLASDTTLRNYLRRSAKSGKKF